MPRHSFEPLRGEIVHLSISSEALEGNLLGDPSTREVAVYLPPGHDEGDTFPLMVDLAGFTGSGLKRLSWTAFGESVPQRLERLVAEGRMGPTIVAFPDAFTTLGGNQYVNSVALGRWEDFLLQDLLPALEAQLPVKPGAGHRAVYGKSSGGYGAMIQAMRHGESWGAVACHSGDMAFEWCYLHDFPSTLDALARYDGSVEKFLAAVEAAPKMRGDAFHVLMTLAMAASYDPDPAHPKGIRLPVDPYTCELDAERWAAWLAHDPVRLVERPDVQERLAGLSGLYVDCGSRDQYHLHYGARTLTRRLQALGIAHRYEEFDDDHSGVDYRLDVSLPWLYDRIT